jgi:hypothetical protein
MENASIKEKYARCKPVFGKRPAVGEWLWLVLMRQVKGKSWTHRRSRTAKRKGQEAKSKGQFSAKAEK